MPQLKFIKDCDSNLSHWKLTSPTSEISGLKNLIKILNELKREKSIQNFSLDRASLSQVFSHFAKHQIKTKVFE